MTRALFLRLATLTAVTLALCFIPEYSFAQHGGGHGGGGGFHGGGFHSGGFGGSFHGGGGFHGGGFGGFNGGGFHHGFSGYPNRFGRGWGWGGWGRGGWGWGGWGWGWGWGWGLGWGWPWWYGYPSYGYSGPYASSCPNYAYYGDCDPYNSPSNGPGDVDPPSNGPGGNYPQGNNSEPDWRHEPDPNQHPNNVQPESSQPTPSHSPGSVSSPDSSLIIVNYVNRPTSDERRLRTGGLHASFAPSNFERVLPKLRPGVRNTILLLRTMPPAARERWFASGRYNRFSPEERQLLREYAGSSAEF